VNKTIVIAGKSEVACLCLAYTKYLSSTTDYNFKLLALPAKSDLKKNDWQPSFAETAKKLKVDICENISDVYDFDNLLFFSLEYDRIIKPDEFRSEALFNIHFSLLPKYRGVYTSIFPILNGDNESGVTLHKIDSGIDTGEIIDQEAFNISGMNAFELYSKYNETAFLVYVRNFNKIFNNNYSSNKQNEANSTYFSRRSLDFSLSNLQESDLSKYDALYIDRIVRAFYFPVYQTATFNGRAVKKSLVIDGTYYGEGKILYLDDYIALLQCRRGKVLLEFC